MRAWQLSKMNPTSCHKETWGKKNKMETIYEDLVEETWKEVAASDT